MTLRVVQPGAGGPRRPLMLFFLWWAGLDAKTRAAFGPGPCIVADDSAKGAETLPEIAEFAHKAAGLQHISALGLAGYSAGCQRVRALRRAGAEASAYLLLDGTHASWPPEAWQIDWLRDIADQARRGRVLVVASHTYQTYTEELTRPLTPFASTVTVLRKATGFALERGGQPEAPRVSRDGQLWVYSYASAKADAKAHSYQAMFAGPKLATNHVGPWLNNPEHPRQAEGAKASSGTTGPGADLAPVLGIGLFLLTNS